MAADSSIYGLIKPAAAAPGPLDQYGQAMTLKNLMGQGDLHALQLKAAQRNFDEEDATSAAYKESGGDPMKLKELLYGRGLVKPAMAAEKNALDTQKTRGEIDKAKAETLKTNVATLRDTLASVNNQAGYDMFRENTAKLVGPDFARTLAPQFTPELKTQYLMKAEDALKRLSPELKMTDTGAGIAPVNPYTGAQQPGTAVIPKTQTPDSIAVDARTRSEGALNRASHFAIAGLGPDGKPVNTVAPGEKIDLAKVDKADLEAAYRYYADGTLPPNMGRGQQGMAESKRLRQIAAQIGENTGVSPEEARANQLAFKGGGQAITALVKREAQVGANVKNFDFNAGQVLDLSQKVDRTGVPVVNAWINAGKRSVTGNPEISAFDVAVKTTVNEFAQIVSGTTAGATTEGEKQKAEKLLSAAQTPEQIASVINQMKIESQNRMKSFADQKKETLGTMRAGGARPAAPATATPAVAPTAGKIKFLGFE